MNNAQRIEMVHKAIQDAKDSIALIYKPKGQSFCHPLDDIKDKKIQEYFYTLNNMCIELADRNVMDWQKEV